MIGFYDVNYNIRCELERPSFKSSGEFSHPVHVPVKALQGMVPHESDSWVLPTHGRPNTDEEGLSHCLCRCLTPPPHVTEQLPQPDQADHIPSKDKIKNTLLFLSYLQIILYKSFIHFLAPKSNCQSTGYGSGIEPYFLVWSPPTVGLKVHNSTIW